MARIVLSLTLVLTACVTWSAMELPPAGHSFTGNPSFVRVVLADSSVLVLRNPAMGGDTLIGSTDIRPNGRDELVKIPAAEIKKIDVLKVNPLKTTIVAIALAVVAIGGTYFWLGVYPST